MKKVIESKNAPAPIGPYSQAVISGNIMYASGQIAIDPLTNKIVNSSIEQETHQVMKNIGGLLKEAGLSYASILKCSIFISDMGQFSRINEVYGSYFKEKFPARETVQVSVLPKNVNIEISFIAELN